MRISAIIALVAFGGIAFLSFQGFKEFFEDKSAGLQYIQEYAQNKGSYPMTGVAAVDAVISLMIYMFRDHVLTNQVQWWIFAEWSAVFASLSWLDVEFTRTQLRFVWLYFLLWNFAGLAPFLAVIFLYYTIAKERQISNGHADRAMSPVHSLVTLIRVAMAFAVPAAMRFYSPKSMEYAWAMVSFMIVPSALDLLWAILPTQPARSSSGDGVVSKTLLLLSYLIAAVGGAYLHISETYNLVNSYGGISQIISTQGSAIIADLTRTGAQKLILYDAPLSFASIFVFIFYDGGIFAMLSTLVLSVIFSPAVAFALFFSRRQVRLGYAGKKDE